MSTTTTNLGLTLPTPNVDSGWGSTLNTDFTLIDDIFAGAGTGTSVGINVGTGKTANVGGTLIAGGTLILGSGDATISAAAATIRGAAKTGTNAVGPNMTIDASNGTGSGGSGSIIFRTAPAAAGGTAANTMATIMEIKSTGSVEVGGRSVNDFMPAGAVMPYAGSSAPSGWLLAYGQAVSRSTYAALYAAIGTTYGSGDGSTTFNVPDMRGRVVAGKDNMGGVSADRLTGLSGGVNGDNLAATGGLETHTLTEAQLAAHQHFVANTASGTGTLTASNYVNYFSDYGSQYNTRLAGSSTVATTGLTSETGDGDAHNNVQPTIILNYIIKT